MKATFPLGYCLLVQEALARWLAEGGLMTTPKIQALGVVQEGSPTRWKATSAVEGGGLAGGLGHEPDRGHGGVADHGHAACGRGRQRKMGDATLCRGVRMTPPQPPTPSHVPRIDWPNLTDEALEELRTLVEAEQQRRWLARRPRSPVDELYDSARPLQPAHAEAFDTYHCRRHGTRRLSRGELRQEERDETYVYVCTLCGEVADPTPLM
jgi:hypothetical protein